LSELGIVTALAAESRPLGRLRAGGGSFGTLVDGTRVAVSGIGGAAAARAASRLVESGVRALVSWGMAGGLDPLLAAGTLVLPREVISSGGARFVTAQEWRERVGAALAARQAVSAGSLLSCGEPIGAPAQKAAAFRTTAAVAVDMESFAVAEIAARHLLPFIAVRAIVDTAQDSLPPFLTAAAVAAGAVRGPQVVGALLRAPGELSALLRLLRRYRAARGALLAVARSGALRPEAARPAAALT
jgi:adenosylhomocysteine nucleosidase